MSIKYYSLYNTFHATILHDTVQGEILTSHASGTKHHEMAHCLLHCGVKLLPHSKWRLYILTKYLACWGKSSEPYVGMNFHSSMSPIHYVALIVLATCTLLSSPNHVKGGVRYSQKYMVDFKLTMDMTYTSFCDSESLGSFGWESTLVSLPTSPVLSPCYNQFWHPTSKEKRHASILSHVGRVVPY